MEEDSDVGLPGPWEGPMDFDFAESFADGVGLVRKLALRRLMGLLPFVVLLLPGPPVRLLE